MLFLNDLRKISNKTVHLDWWLCIYFSALWLPFVSTSVLTPISSSGVRTNILGSSLFLLPDWFIKRKASLFFPFFFFVVLEPQTNTRSIVRRATRWGCILCSHIPPVIHARPQYLNKAHICSRCSTSMYALRASVLIWTFVTRPSSGNGAACNKTRRTMYHWLYVPHVFCVNYTNAVRSDAVMLSVLDKSWTIANTFTT